MERTGNKLAKVLALAKKIMAICEGEESPQKAREICPQCKEREVTPGRRGLCGACWMRTRRKLDAMPEKKRAAAEEKLIAAGLLLPPSVGGRKSGENAMDAIVDELAGNPTRGQRIGRHAASKAKRVQDGNGPDNE